MTCDYFRRIVESVDLSRFAIPARIEVRRDEHFDGLTVVAALSVRDVRTGSPVTVYTMESFPARLIGRMLPEQGIANVYRLLVRALQHELDECLFVGGKQLLDPHRNERTRPRP